MASLAHKVKTLVSLDLSWAVRFTKKRIRQYAIYLVSKMRRRYYWTTPYGVKLGFNTAYHHSIAYAHSLKLHEPVVLDLFAKHARTAKLIYDCGGYNGVFGLTAAKVNPNARVVIFEPDAVNFQQIQANIKLNDLNNCSAEQKAITNYNGTIQFRMDGTSGARIGSGPLVSCARLDALPLADLLKLDIEGAESDAIEGANLLQHPVIFLEHHHWCPRANEMWHKLIAHGYRENIINYERDGVHHLLV
jgi:FkbM family methyltransferase